MACIVGESHDGPTRMRHGCLLGRRCLVYAARRTVHPRDAHIHMFIHSALFWLRKDLTPAERETFASEVRLLAKLPYLESGFVGTPAQTERRAVADHSFDFATSLHFKSLEDHEFYQSKCEHHARFVSTCSSLWERVVIHDIDPLA